MTKGKQVQVHGTMRLAAVEPLQMERITGLRKSGKECEFSTVELQSTLRLSRQPGGRAADLTAEEQPGSPHSPALSK